jgi:hypothetical protein
MPLSNFPAILQPIVQQGFLSAEFERALQSKLAYRAIADREKIPVGRGETITKTRTGLKAPVTAALTPSTNTNLDNGLTSSGWGVEQFTLSMNMYADTMDLNMVTSRVGAMQQFLRNAEVNGFQAGQTLDRLARAALFGAYMGGNTRVRVALGAAGPTIQVDDVRGFQVALVNGVPIAISATNPLSVTVGATVYSITGFAIDGSNASSAILAGGQSGTLTASGNIATADATLNAAVVASNAPLVVRSSPAGTVRATTQALTATDTMMMNPILDAVARLRANNVPGVGGGSIYNCYIDPISHRQLFSDSAMLSLFTGTGMKDAYGRALFESPSLGVRMITTTESYVQPHPTLAGVSVRRAVVAGQGALIEGDFAGMAAQDVAPDDAIIDVVDDVVQVTRYPLDRLQQIIAQSWYWIGGFCVPTDSTATTTIIPTSSNSLYKRAVVVEAASVP